MRITPEAAEAAQKLARAAGRTITRVKYSKATIEAAGKRALAYYWDTGDCLFCNVDNNDGHEDHCTFYIARGEEGTK